MLFAVLRFASFRTGAFLARRPAVPWRIIATYGGLLFAGQFGLMFYAMEGLITTRLASLVIKTLVCFTVLLGVTCPPTFAVLEG